MFSKIKGAFLNAVNNLDGQLDPIVLSGDSYVGAHRFGEIGPMGKPLFALPSNLKRSGKEPFLKYRYTRPHFLQLNSDDEIQVSADQVIRPIIVPRDITKLPWNSGYAEAVNAGKSVRNEDQASIFKGLLQTVISKEIIQNKIAKMVTIKRGPIKPAYRLVPHNQAQEVSNIQKQVISGSEVVRVIPGEMIKKKVFKEEDKNESFEVLGEDNLASTSAESSIANSDSLPSSSSIKHETDPLDVLSSTVNNSVEEIKPDITAVWSGTSDDLISPSTPLPFSTTEPIPTSMVSSIAPNVIERQITTQQIEESLPYVYFGIFDGHAGSGVAVAAANRLHRIIHEKLQSIADLLITFGIDEYPSLSDNDPNFNKKDSSKGIIYKPNFPPDTYFSTHDPVKDKTVSVDNLIVGALEKAFWEMDQEIERDKIDYYMRGGCTALAALFILGKLFVANAGDSRGIVYKDGEILPMSFDFTPASERTRIQYLGSLRPEFLGNDFTHLEFIRRPLRKDLGKELLYRDAYMSGWAYKIVKPEDLRFPLIYGEGKRSRVAATIGVTRGFGDHELKAGNSDIYLKPFLTSQPEVKIMDLEMENLTDSDVLIMGTDGLWDRTSNEKAVEIVQKALDHFPANDPQRFKYRYISAAQDLVMHSRGKSRDNGSWRTANEEPATIDDISTFVIPLKPYQQEYIKWKEARRLVRTQSTSTPLFQSKVTPKSQEVKLETVKELNEPLTSQINQT